MGTVVLEKEIEQYLVKRVKEIHGVCHKWVSPGNSGVPDRIVIHDGRVVFVEVKRPGGKPRADQIAVHEKLRSVGADVRVIDTKDKVNELISELMIGA